MAYFAPFPPICLFHLIFIFQLLGPVFCATVYLKKQYGENEFRIESWGKTNCSLNGIDIVQLGIGRTCEDWPDLATIFCDGKILEAVNYWGERMLFMRDSKHFVDRPLLKDAKKVVEEFKTLFDVTEWNKFMVSEMSEAQVDKLAKFVQQNFGMADGALIEHVPEDWVESPQKFKEIKDKKLRKWATELNKMWKELSKKMPENMDNNGNQRHSLIYLSNPFFVSGGRFREFRYWDCYWMARGLIASGMTKSVKNMCRNFAEMINRFGFVPAGGRIYYNKRSQPPFLTFLVYDYFASTGDIEFLKEIMPTLEKELNFWQTNRSVQIKVNGKTKTFYQYRADTKLPRPEAFCQDVELVKEIADPMEKAKIWHEIASASESGWDFSSRWIRKDETDTEKPWKLKNLMTTKIVPVDLNAIICGNFEKMAQMYLQIGNKVKSREYHAKYQLFLEDFKSLFYKKEHGIWYDFNFESGTPNEAYYGSAAVPLFTHCYDTIDLSAAVRIFDRMGHLDDDKKLISPFGVSTSQINSSQQWDFPNIFPSTQLMLIEGLRKSGTKRMKDKAKELAQNWVSANFELFNSKNCGAKVWEKITANEGLPGRGGEYNAQINVGTAIGVLLDTLVTYGGELNLGKIDGSNCEQKDLEIEPRKFPNEVAVIYEPFALLTDAELKKLDGVFPPIYGPQNQQLKTLETLNIETQYSNDNDLPRQFDARKKWPGCADIISTITDQGLCGCCWAVASASTLTDRICIARLKKGQKTSHYGGSYISAQFTCEFTPGSDGCKVVGPAWLGNFFIKKQYLGQIMKCTMDASWKTKRPNCKKECRIGWHQTVENEMVDTPTVIGHECWIGWHFGNEQKMMREIMVNGSITASYAVYDDFQITMRSPNSRKEENGHSVKIIGWGEEKKGNEMVKYWLIVNSRGKGWGMNGLFKMRRGVNEVDIEGDVCFGTPAIFL
ncbi:hypothetical protein niasHS_004125 [Heterodera schachtii]|uniref:Trehalase n=1 Tax=Heterodera schachtii TaxID=97005 RepID=A0ABD2JY02_HETSC